MIKKVTEAFTAWLLDPTLGDRAMAVAVLVRFLCWHGVVLPGAVFVLTALRRSRYADPG